MNRKSFDKNNGATLVVVMMVVFLCSAAVTCILFATGVRVQRSYNLVWTEQAFYLAEAGIERAAAWGQNNFGMGTETVLEGDLGDGSYVAHVTLSEGSNDSYDIYATGTVRNVNRGITVRGMQFASWSQFALWYDKESPSGLWIIPGEVFDGKFYSRPLMKFSSTGLGALDSNGRVRGPAHFTDTVETHQNYIEYQSGAYPILDKGISTGVPIQSMADVDFGKMLQTASSLESSGKGLVLEGNMTIELDGKIMKITSTDKTNREQAGNVYSRSITNHTLNIVYVKPYSYTYYYKTSSGYWRARNVTELGDITLLAPDGFSGDMSLVANHDIRISDHVRYSDNPEENPDSEDKLGLIAQNNVVVQSTPTLAPNNLEIYAHIFCKKGGFGVERYDSGPFRGDLKVYGGIANDIRRAVGTFSSYSRTGYNKTYFFDKRFRTKRPMHYPYKKTAMTFDAWEG